MMTRIVSWIFFAGLGVLALLLVLPGFIDWSRHKDLLVSEISARLGQEVRIGGDVSLSLLPNPRVKMESVVIGPEGKDRYLAALESLEARVSFSELLHGRFHIEHINLNEPIINIIDGKQGSNWTLFLEAIRRDAAEEEAAGRKTAMIQLRQMSVERAKLVYRTADGAARWELPQINLTLDGTNIAGPYSMRGDFLYGDEPVTFTLTTAARHDDGGIPFEAHIQPIDGMPAVELQGRLTPGGTDAVVASVTTENGALRQLLRPFPAYYEALDEIPFIDDASAKSTFDLALSAQKTVLRQIQAQLGRDGTLAGDVIFYNGQGDVDADVTLTTPHYWMSFKGKAEVAQRVFKGDITLKAEDISGWAPGLPAISAEVTGMLTRSAPDAWSIAEMRLSLVDWPGLEMKGRAQRKGAETSFSLQGITTPAVTSAKFDGRALPEGIEASGTAKVYGQDATFTLKGAAARPDVTVDLAKVEPGRVMSELKLSAPMLSFESGTTAFKGHLDMGATELADIIVGDLALTPTHVLINHFNPLAMAEAALTPAKVPNNLSAQMLEKMKKGKGRFSARAMNFKLPLSSRRWAMDEVNFTGGSFTLTREENGAVKVDVKEGADGMPPYHGTLPLTAKDLPVSAVADMIRARNPMPEVITHDAIGGIIDRLNQMEAPTGAEAQATPDTDYVDIFKTMPPSMGEGMPPQPQPALPEIEIGLPPSLPPDEALAVDPVPPVGIDEDAEKEIFPDER
jgi:hypothetical protein